MFFVVKKNFNKKTKFTCDFPAKTAKLTSDFWAKTEKFTGDFRLLSAKLTSDFFFPICGHFFPMPKGVGKFEHARRHIQTKGGSCSRDNKPKIAVGLFIFFGTPLYLFRLKVTSTSSTRAVNSVKRS